MTLLDATQQLHHHSCRIIARNTEDPYEVLIRKNPQTFSVDRKSQPTTTATASGPLSTSSPAPATISAKPSTATLAAVSRN